MSAPSGQAVVAVVGPTAAGKSDLGIALARALGGEVVNTDSMQLYRGMDIGTAKLTPAERAGVPHHLLDIWEVTETASVAEYQRLARAAVDALRTAGRVAVLVGGSGLYVRAVLDRMEFPGTDPAGRTALEAELAAVGPGALHRRLAELDPVAAGRIEPGNRRRTVRALEVVLGSGRPFSSYGPGLQAYPPTAVTMIGLRWPRPALAERVATRVGAMMAAGLLDEVARVAAGGLSRTAAQALGYKELIEHLEGRSTLDAAVDSIIVRTRQFAVRQDRWFRRDPRVRWIDVDRDPVAEAVPAVVDALTSEPEPGSAP